LRVKGIDFTKHPVTIHLRAEVTKDRKPRYCFISDGATYWLKEHLVPRLNNSDASSFRVDQGVRKP